MDSTGAYARTRTFIGGTNYAFADCATSRQLKSATWKVAVDCKATCMPGTRPLMEPRALVYRLWLLCKISFCKYVQILFERTNKLINLKSYSNTMALVASSFIAMSELVVDSRHGNFLLELQKRCRTKIAHLNLFQLVRLFRSPLFDRGFTMQYTVISNY